ncbi:hypothetical protein Tco_0270650 [Tanacetum coccineum]
MDCNQIAHTGADCTKLVNLYDIPSPCEFLIEILNLQGRRHIFQFHYNPQCEKVKIDFYFDDILDKSMQITSGSEAETQTPAESEMSTSALKSPQLPAKETTHGQTTTSPSTPSQLTTGHLTTKTPAPTEPALILKETPATSTKEIDSESPDNKTHDEEATQEMSSKRTSRRPLFQGDAGE